MDICFSNILSNFDEKPAVGFLNILMKCATAIFLLSNIAFKRKCIMANSFRCSTLLLELMYWVNHVASRAFVSLLDFTQWINSILLIFWLSFMMTNWMVEFCKIDKIISGFNSFLILSWYSLNLCEMEEET